MRHDGHLIYCKSKGQKIKHILNVTSLFNISHIKVNHESEQNVIPGKVVIKVECNRDNASGLPTSFRAIMSKKEVLALCQAAKQVSKNHNVNIFLPLFMEETANVPLEPEHGKNNNNLITPFMNV